MRGPAGHGAPEHRRLAPIRRLDAPFQHVVLIRLRDPLDTADLVDACNAMASVIPSVRSVFVGLPEDTGHEGVIRDYDVCLILGFEDAAGCRSYSEHPAHTGALAAWSDRIEWLRIHDALDVPE